jgi:hypothetical protein
MSKRGNFTDKQAKFLVEIQEMKRGVYNYKNIPDQFLEKYPKWINPKYAHLPYEKRMHWYRETIKSKRQDLLNKKKDKKPVVHDYSNSPAKRWVQPTLFDTCPLKNVECGGMLASPLSAGPYIDSLITRSIMSKYISYEYNQKAGSLETYHLQQIAYGNDPRFEINFGDISNIRAIPFMDIDLVGRWETVENTLITCFKTQQTLKESINSFYFTMCLDRISMDKMDEHITKCLSTLLNTPVTYTNKEDKIAATLDVEINGKKRKSNVKQCLIKDTGKYQVIAYKYKDSRIMFSCAIHYKMGKKGVVKLK